MTTQTIEHAGIRPQDLEDYRQSHSTAEYGRRYQDTYERGYYYYQWNYIERDLIRRLLQEARDHGHSHCLDFACGTGRITSVAREIFASTAGVDVSESMLEIARCELPDVEFFSRDITCEPLEQQFDVVTAFRFFTNAEDELRRDALRAIHAALAENGLLVANIHVNAASPVGRLYQLRNWLTGRTTARVVAHRQFAELLEECSFELVQTHWYSFLPRTGWRFPWLARHLMQPVERLFAAVKFLPRRWASCFVVVCRKR